MWIRSIFRIDDEISAKLVEGMTDVVHESVGDHSWVIVGGNNPKNWGLFGKPRPLVQMEV